MDMVHLRSNLKIIMFYIFNFHIWKFDNHVAKKAQNRTVFIYRCVLLSSYIVHRQTKVKCVESQERTLIHYTQISLNLSKKDKLKTQFINTIYETETHNRASIY